MAVEDASATCTPTSGQDRLQRPLTIALHPVRLCKMTTPSASTCPVARREEAMMKRCWILCAAIILWTASITSAQTASGAIQGTVSDQRGGILIGARLTLI